MTMDYKAVAESIIKLTKEFQKGCSNTQRALVPTDCAECTRAFVSAIQRLIIEETAASKR